MAKGYVLFNPKAGNGEYTDKIRLLETVTDDELLFFDLTEINDYRAFLQGFADDDYIILCGGDGTLNCFVNGISDIECKAEILYYPTGSGNDFAREFGKERGANPFSVTEYLKGLPSVTVNGKSYRFINGVGFGIDGYCCKVGDEQRKTSDKPINYAAIAIKGMLFHYTPVNAKITVDGNTYEYSDVWLAPTMNGKYYGGGMIPAPEQKRNGGKLSVLVYHGKSKLRTLCIFPSLFKGTHIKHSDVAEVLSGNSITVEFDRPESLQIDGETVLGVTSYTAISCAKFNYC